MRGNPSKNPAIWHSMENDPWIWREIRVYGLIHQEYSIMNMVYVLISVYIEILYCYIAVYSWYIAWYTMRTSENSHDEPWCTDHIPEHPILYLVYTVIYWVYTNFQRYMLGYAGICMYKTFWQKCHNMGIRTVNLMHTARLTSPLDLERWCSNSFLHGIRIINSILNVISYCMSPACWCQTSGVDVQCEHTKRVTCPARGPFVYIQRVQAQGARQGPSPTARERKRAHAPPKTHPMHLYFCTLAWQIHKGSHMRRFCSVESTCDQVHTTSQRQAGERRRWNFS